MSLWETVKEIFALDPCPCEEAANETEEDEFC